MTKARKSRVVVTAVAAAASLALLLGGCSPSGGAAAQDVTLNFTWWGNEERAGWMEDAIAIFEKDNPTITVNGSFADYDGYWQKRTTEAAGGGLPDVMLFDYSLLNDYGTRGLLLDLQGDKSELDVSKLPEQLLSAGKINDKLVAVTTGTNIFSVITNPALAAAANQTLPADPSGWDWDQFNQFISSVTAATDKFGGDDYAGQMPVLELQLRQEGGNLFTEDGKLGFDRDRLREFWNSTKALRDAHDVDLPADAEQVAPLTPTSAGLSASLFGYNSTLPNYLTNAKVDALSLTPPPTSDPKNSGLYLHPSLQLAASAKTAHSAQATKFINFMINDPRVAEIFGTSLGLPASSTQLDALTLTGANAQIADYQKQMEPFLGETPPPSPKGSGSLQTNFLRVFGDILYGKISVDDGVEQWFTEAETTLGE
jgi:multiple sugar transport system substrate-binding protein